MKKPSVNLDDLTIPEFAFWDSYSQFSRRVKRERRYASID